MKKKDKRPIGKRLWKRWANRMKAKAKHPDSEAGKMLPVDGSIPIGNTTQAQPTEKKSSIDLLSDL